VHKNQISSNELKSLHSCKKNSLEKPKQQQKSIASAKTAAKKNQNSSRRQY
jgi:hypothetical protein